MTVGKDFIFFVNQTLMRFFSSCINMFNVVLGRLGPEPGRLQPVCSVYSLNLDTLDAVKMCNFSPVIWMTKSLQTGWHCTYLASTHWHGNLAAFNRRCHFPTTQKQRGFHAASPGASPWQPRTEGLRSAERGLQETLVLLHKSAGYAGRYALFCFKFDPVVTQTTFICLYWARNEIEKNSWLKNEMMKRCCDSNTDPPTSDSPRRQFRLLSRGSVRILDSNLNQTPHKKNHMLKNSLEIFVYV